MFSQSKPNVTILISEVQTCSKASSWGTLMVITINAINRNFMDSYGCLTLPEHFKGEQAWKAIAPKSGEAHAKTVGMIAFHWCPHHGFWTVHKPNECTLAPTTTACSVETSKPGTKTASKPPLSWAQAMTAVICNHNDTANEESDA
jgi:hypothetical protein